MFLFILGIVLLLVTLLAAYSSSKPVIAVVGILVFLLCIASSTMGTVDTKNVGVVTSFKKPTGETKSAGLYVKAPWKNVTDMSLAWQTATYQYVVQAAGGTTIGLDVRPRWRMTESAAPELFQNYKDTEGVINNLFRNELYDASNKIFAGYNPLTNLDTESGLPLRSKEQWASDLQKELNTRFAGKIELDRLAIITIAPDEKTQEKLNQQVAEFGRGKILDQQKTNADKEKQITETNAKVNPVARCLEIAEKTNGEPGWCLNPGIAVGSK